MLKRFVLHLEWHRGYRPHVSLRRMPQAGDRVMNGGQLGTLLTCHTCSGTGTLHQPDWLRDAVYAPLRRGDILRTVVHPGDLDYDCTVSDIIIRNNTEFKIISIENRDGRRTFTIMPVFPLTEHEMKVRRGEVQ